MSVIVVVTGSSADNRFAVTDFSVPTAATTVFVIPPFQGGCVVACSGTLAAVGHYEGDEVAIYDLSNPAVPGLQGTFGTGLGQAGGGGIGAVSLDGTNLLAGQQNGPNIVLVDIGKPASQAPVSTITSDGLDGGIAALVLKGSLAIASGLDSFVVLDYAAPAAPVVLPYVPDASNGNVTFQGTVTCDFDGSTAALGDESGAVYVFAIAAGGQAEYAGQSGFGFEAVTSVAVMVNQVAAAFIGSGLVSLIGFDGSPSPSSNLVAVGSGSGADPGGALKFYGLPTLAVGTNNGSGATLFNTSVWPNASPMGVAGSANLAPTLRPTLGFTAFKPVVMFPPWPWPWWRIDMFPGWLLHLLRNLFG